MAYCLVVAPASIPVWVQEIWNVMLSIGDFFIYIWNDENRWWYIGGLLIAIIFICKVILVPLWNLFRNITSIFGGRSYYGNFSAEGPNIQKHSSRIGTNNTATVIIKGVYQMNGPKPFTRTIHCTSSKTGYYSQLMGNKSKQARWIQANFPGANVSKGFSMTVNIK